MKHLITLVLIAFCIHLDAQVLGMKEVEGPYVSPRSGAVINVGDTLQLGYGSKADNSFSFVWVQVGKGIMAQAMPAPDTWSNGQVVVEKIVAPKKNKDSKVPLCKPITNALPGQEIYLWFDYDNAVGKEEISSL